MMKTWRSHKFVEKTKYRVKVTFKNQIDSFIEGEELEFLESTYSSYDSSSGFIFCDKQGNIKTWFLHDDEINNQNEFFQMMENEK